MVVKLLKRIRMKQIFYLLFCQKKMLTKAMFLIALGFVFSGFNPPKNTNSFSKKILHQAKKSIYETIAPTNIWGLGDLIGNTTTPWTQATFQVSATSDRTPDGVLCNPLTCPTVSDEANTTDSDLTNYATIEFPTLGVFADASIRVTETDEDYAAGPFVGFKIEKVGGLVDLDLFDNLTIRTYLNGTLQESQAASSLLSASLLGGGAVGPFDVGLWTTMDFDAVELYVAQPVGIGLGGEIRVYHALLEKAENGAALQCNGGLGTIWTKPSYPVRIDNNNTGVTGVCVGCSLTGESNIIDMDLNNYASATVLVGLAGGVEVSLVDPVISSYPAGSFAGFVVEDMTGLLGLSLLEAFEVETYLDGTLQESATSSQLVDLPIFISNNRSTVGFNTTVPFDEIRLKVISLASLLVDVRIYHALTAPMGCIMIDSDNDSVYDSIEDAAPNGGDGNDDGIPDKNQPSVASLVRVDGGYVTLQATGTCTQITNITCVDESNLSAESSAYVFPYGLVDFELDCIAPGGIANLTYFWHGVESLEGFEYVKEGPIVPDEVSRTYYAFSTSLSELIFGGMGSTTATNMVMLIDGLQGDDTGLDGKIVDPAGPALAIISPGGVLNNLTHWARADYEVYSDAGLTFANPGDPVPHWQDLSPSDFTLTASGAERPTFVQGSRATNFNPALDFSNNYMTNPSQVVPAGSDMTMFAVGMSNGTAGVKTIYAYGDNGNDPALNVDGSQVSPSADGSTPTTTNLFSGDIPASKPLLLSMRGENAATTADDLTVSYQGREVDANGMDVPNSVNLGNTIDVGGGDASTANWDGQIMELITYDRKLTAAEMQQVNSYLAVKYGITLRLDDNDPTITEGNYVASDGVTVFWNSTLNLLYHNDVAGVGRDDDSYLYQKQSTALESDFGFGDNDAFVTIALGNTVEADNESNSNNVLLDNNFMMWGNNNLDTAYTINYVPATPQVGALYRMARTWKIQETGLVGTVTISVPEETNAEFIFVDLNESFAPATATSTALVPDGNGNLIATLDFLDGQYFTFARVDCTQSPTFTCTTGSNIDLTEFVLSYLPGGTWTDVSGSGANITIPQNVDLTGLADGEYIFNYTFLGGTECFDVVVTKTSPIPAPVVDNLDLCAGEEATILMPLYNIPQEQKHIAEFDGPEAYAARGRCTGTTIATCSTNDATVTTLEQVTLMGDFSTMTRSTDHILRKDGELQFQDTNGEFCLESAPVTIIAGDHGTVSVDFRRVNGVLESDDYIRISTVVNGVETLEKEYTGAISDQMQTFRKTNITGTVMSLKVCIKTGDGLDGDGALESVAIGRMESIVSTFLPTYNFYDADPTAGPATLLGTGMQYEAGTTSATSPEDIWVTCSINGCESDPTLMSVNVSDNPITPMDGALAFYCPAGPGASPIFNLQDLVTNYQAGGVWTDDSASGVNISDPTNVDFTGVPAGVYYFTYAIGGAAPCNGSQTMVAVTIDEIPEEIPALSANTINNTCPDPSVDLNSLITSTTPANSSIVWSTDGDSSDGVTNPVADPTAVTTSDTYYAYYLTNGCYSEASAPVIATVVNCNTAPVITSAAAVDFLENGTGVAYDTETTDDYDTEGSGLTYSFTGNAVTSPDEAAFAIDASTGEVTFLVAPDFEIPGDMSPAALPDNTYDIEIQVCDNGPGIPLCAMQIVNITITDEDEDNDGFTSANGETDDADPCVPSNAASPCCEAASPTITKD